MAVNVRLLRMGKKKQAYYRIVTADSRRARDGRFLEIIGTYNPITNPAEVKINEDKLTKWLNDGATPTSTVKTLLTQIGFIEKYNKAKKGEDVSAIELKGTINERKKKTRKIKKAAIAAAETAAAEAAAKEKEAEEAAAKKAEDAKAAKEAKATEGDAPAE